MLHFTVLIHACAQVDHVGHVTRTRPSRAWHRVTTCPLAPRAQAAAVRRVPHRYALARRRVRPVPVSPAASPVLLVTRYVEAYTNQLCKRALTINKQWSRHEIF